MQQILDALQEAESLESLAQMLEDAKGRMSEGEGMTPQEIERAKAQLRAMIQRLERGAGGSPGNSRGRGEGGNIKKGPDDGREGTPTKIDGQLDPTGNMGRSIKFKGVPRANESREKFKKVVANAVKDAEESLERDAIPADAKPFVKRYFEALKER